MRKLISLRLLMCLVGTLALAATAVIGASLTDTAVTNDVLVARSAGESSDPARAPVGIEPSTGSADDSAAPAVVDAGENSTPDGPIGTGGIGDNVAPIKGGTLDGAAAAVRFGLDVDPGVATLNTESSGTGAVTTTDTTDVSQAGSVTDSGGVAAGGLPNAGSAAGASPFVGLGNDLAGRGSDTDSAALVPEAATFVLVVFPLLAALIIRLRG